METDEAYSQFNFNSLTVVKHTEKKQQLSFDQRSLNYLQAFALQFRWTLYLLRAAFQLQLATIVGLRLYLQHGLKCDVTTNTIYPVSQIAFETDPCNGRINPLHNSRGLAIRYSDKYTRLMSNYKIITLQNSCYKLNIIILD